MTRTMGGAFGLLLFVFLLGCNPQPKHVVIDPMPPATPGVFRCGYQESTHNYGCLETRP